MRDVRRLPGELPGLRMERYLVRHAARAKETGMFLPLTRYRQGKPARRGPVLLIHGLGASGNQFCTTRVDANLAQHLAAAGFDVWVAELRTSIALPYSGDQWTIDQVAREDVPRIVDAVLEQSGAAQLDVVAHCIGSAMFCSAVLAGRLQRQSGASKVRSAVLLQVGPLVTLSKGTRLRALAIAPVRGLLPAGHLDFSVDDRAGWLESLVDRLLNTYPYPAAEARHHRPGRGGSHARHIANCNRWAAIDGRMISHGNLSERMLEGLGEVLGHASITTWQQTLQYALLERLTDSQGSDCYVTTENVERFFTFPVRFLHGAENDVFAPLTAWRSRELLRRVHGRDFPAEVVLLPGYSHMDPLIGKAAQRDVFPHVSGFLERAHAPWRAPPHEPRQFHLRRPLLGPLLGWLRPAGEGWRVRLWCRLDDRRSPVSFALVQLCAGGQCRPARAIQFGESIGAHGELTSLVAGTMDTLLCVDVDLGPAPGRYRISVRSAHAAVEDEASAEQAHRQAEAAAGMPLSRRRPLATEDILALVDGAQNMSEVSLPSADSEDDKLGEAVARVPEGTGPFTFYVASCRYPGWLVDRDIADEAFAGMKRTFERRQEEPAALFLIGDQIYADATAGVFDPRDHRQRFYDAYQEAWSAPAARAVLGRVPTYMMMDDHEAGNDWHPQDALDAEDAAMREEGLKAYRRYQWLHSPGNGAGRRRADGTPAYHYSFDLRGTAVFVCDTRRGRDQRREILDPAQFAELARWLASQPREAIKVVVSPSVLVPFLQSTREVTCVARSDGWDGFHDALPQLFSILGAQMDNVLFLCGDAHLSLSSEIWFERDGRRFGGTCYCIVASPLYAPYPFANADPQDFLHDNAARPVRLADGVVMRYRVIPDSIDLGKGFTAVTMAPHGPPSVVVRGAAERRFVLEPGCSLRAAALLHEP
jgi:alpha-beta hydrolase superfamily lysophospholipase